MEASPIFATTKHAMMPHRAPQLLCAARTDTGRVRTSNEDSLEFDLDAGLFVLADGMGGCNGGEIASAMAVQAVAREFRQLPLSLPQDDMATAGLSHAAVRLCTAVAKANREVFQQALAQPNLSGMGTTLVSTLFFGHRVIIASIGDSRVYRLRQGHFEQLTVDHTILQEQLEYGLITPEQARFAGNRGLITRALGVEATVEVDVQEQPLLSGDLYLLCSDGLFDMMEDTDIQFIIEHANDDVELACDRLLKAALYKGGYDNISLILVRAS